MKQTIVALIRPNLNLSQKESQAAHLIEHILVMPTRLEKMGIDKDFYAKNIIYHSGLVNDFYLAEYFVVRAEGAEKITQALTAHQDELYIEKTDFDKIKSALTEEIQENKGEFISIGEQFCKATYVTGSPSIRNQWDDLDSVVNLSIEDTGTIFKKYNTNLTLLELSFDKTKVSQLPTIEKNILVALGENIKLVHPWLAPKTMDNSYIIRLPEKTDYLVNALYQGSLIDSRFGLLYNELRNNLGLVYDISLDIDYNTNSLEFFFSSSEENAPQITCVIIKSLKNYHNFIKKNLDYLKERLILGIELDWNNAQNICTQAIDLVISKGFIESPASVLARINKATIDDLSNFNDSILNALEHKAISVKRIYGKKVSTKISKNRPEGRLYK